jgi:hypothetical protein
MWPVASPNNERNRLGVSEFAGGNEFLPRLRRDEPVLLFSGPQGAGGQAPRKGIPTGRMLIRPQQRHEYGALGDPRGREWIGPERAWIYRNLSCLSSAALVFQ